MVLLNKIFKGVFYFRGLSALFLCHRRPNIPHKFVILKQKFTFGALRIFDLEFI